MMMIINVDDGELDNNANRDNAVVDVLRDLEHGTTVTFMISCVKYLT